MKAYYRNTYFGKESQGEITYRFMLGKNTTNDFNVERNFHYKLILSFVGDANNVDWHIDYEEEKDLTPYFPIPTDDGRTGSEYLWEKSWVWHAYNDEGEPIAEICKELVFCDKDSKTLNYTMQHDKDNLLYYQVVTVYPVKRHDDKTGKYKYVTDLSHGVIAQVLACDSKMTLDDNDLKANGKINMLLHTQPDPDMHDNKTTRSKSTYGEYTIRELENGGEENYDYVNILSETYNQPITKTIMLNLYPEVQPSGKNWSFTEENIESGKINIYDLKLGDKTDYEWRIRPYRIADANGREYPIVKIGSSYWMRENLKATNYFNVSNDGTIAGIGKPIYPYKGPISNIEYEGWEDDWTIPGVGADGYDYDAGPGGDGQGYVSFYERYPMYKQCGSEILYNYFAVSGTQAVNGSYKAENEADPYFDPVVYFYHINQLGTISDKYIDVPESGVVKANTADAESYEYREFNLNQYNLPLAPEGWHALPMMEGAYVDDYGAMECDIDYIERYTAFAWERLISDEGFNRWTWPSSKNYGANILKRNLSGLTLLPIPADWETNTAGILLDVGISGLINNTINGVVIPFWTSTLQYQVKTAPFYPHATFLRYDTSDGDGIVGCTNFSANLTIFNDYVGMSYLPVRCVRNAYDYSVTPIEPISR